MGKTNSTTTTIGFIAIVLAILTLSAGIKGNILLSVICLLLLVIAGFIWVHFTQKDFLKRANNYKNNYNNLNRDNIV